mmetsp:Transcript_28776/g.91870  ORF Transcript_28776/g.91870 Transcript_28776/m.91870 type:complete len:223 (-) Transcript_28776:119-787(-)
MIYPYFANHSPPSPPLPLHGPLVLLGKGQAPQEDGEIRLELVPPGSGALVLRVPARGNNPVADAQQRRPKRPRGQADGQRGGDLDALDDAEVVEERARAEAEEHRDARELQYPTEHPVIDDGGHLLDLPVLPHLGDPADLGLPRRLGHDHGVEEVGGRGGGLSLLPLGCLLLPETFVSAAGAHTEVPRAPPEGRERCREPRPRRSARGGPAVNNARSQIGCW